MQWNRRGLAARLGNELGPAVLFFVVLLLGDVESATIALVLATVVATTVSWRRERRLPVLPLATLALTAVLGGLTLALDDALFVKLRPTITNLAGAAGLAGALALGRLPLRHALDGALDLPDGTWRRLTQGLILFLLLLAGLNEVIWRSTDTATWAAFKAFVLPALNGLFVLAAWAYARNAPLRQERAPASSSTGDA